MNINQIIGNGMNCYRRDKAREFRNKQLGVIRGPLPRWARKQSLSGIARKIGQGFPNHS